MAEPLDPEKYHVLSGRQKRNLILVAVLILVITLPPFSYSYYKFAVKRPAPTDKELTLEIRRGDTVPEIASKLNNEGVINSETLFTFYVFINGLDKSLQAGIYTIPAGSSIVEIAGQFQHGVNDVSITFIEGWRVEEFAREAAQKLEKIDYREFVNLVANKEGYLFPDTYSFNKDATEQEVVDALTNTFNKKTKDILTKENLEKAGLTREEALIFASIVEREVNNSEDRPVVAGILIKRWREGMNIAADATTQYAVALNRLCANNGRICTPTIEELYELNWWPHDLTLEELAYDSSYNTRKNVGLPPAPISSFGQNALLSVINYEDSDYYYYINDSAGNTHFAKTLDEHNDNIAKYLVQ